MNTRFLLTVIAACQILLVAKPASAGDGAGLLTPSEKKVYHACLYAHYIDHYCRYHAWGFTHLTFRDCVIANGACECVFANGGYWGPDIDYACRAASPVRVR